MFQNNMIKIKNLKKFRERNYDYYIKIGLYVQKTKWIQRVERLICELKNPPNLSHTLFTALHSPLKLMQKTFKDLSMVTFKRRRNIRDRVVRACLPFVVLNSKFTTKPLQGNFKCGACIN